MPDNLSRRRPEDPKKVNINQAWEIQYWTRELGVSESQLIRAVNSVGPMVEDVKSLLRVN